MRFVFVKINFTVSCSSKFPYPCPCACPCPNRPVPVEVDDPNWGVAEFVEAPREKPVLLVVCAVCMGLAVREPNGEAAAFEVPVAVAVAAGNVNGVAAPAAVAAVVVPAPKMLPEFVPAPLVDDPNPPNRLPVPVPVPLEADPNVGFDPNICKNKMALRKLREN